MMPATNASANLCFMRKFSSYCNLEHGTSSGPRQGLLSRLKPSGHPRGPGAPELVAGVKFFGRYRSGAIRDGVLLYVS